MATTIIYTGRQTNASAAASTSGCPQVLTNTAAYTDKTVPFTLHLERILSEGPVAYPARGYSIPWWYYVMPFPEGTAAVILTVRDAVNYIIAYLRRFGGTAPCTDGGE